MGMRETALQFFLGVDNLPANPLAPTTGGIARAALGVAVATQLPGRNNGPADIFRHLVWGAEMTRRFGREHAEQALNIVEKFDFFNNPIPRFMDETNNIAAIKIGEYALAHGMSYSDVIGIVSDIMVAHFGGTVFSDFSGSSLIVGPQQNWQFRTTGLDGLYVTRSDPSAPTEIRAGLAVPQIAMMTLDNWSNNPKDANNNEIPTSDANWPSSRIPFALGFIYEQGNPSHLYSIENNHKIKPSASIDPYLFDGFDSARTHEVATEFGSVGAGTPNNSFLDNTTDTAFTPQIAGATSDTEFVQGIAEGFLARELAYSVWMPPAFIDEDSTGNAVLLGASQIPADLGRPGNHNLSDPWLTSSTLLTSAAIEGPAEIGNYIAGAVFNSSFYRTSSVAYTDPLVLDLNGDGVSLTSWGDAPVLFDIDHDGGSKELTGWVDEQDGILVHDLDQDGHITHSGEMLSEYYNSSVGVKAFANGFAALSSLDANADQRFDAVDPLFAVLRVWRDADHDGVTDAGELIPLGSLGIESIDLVPTAQSGEVRDGNEVLARGSYNLANGTSREAIAVNFLADPRGNALSISGSGVTVSNEGGFSTYVASSGTGETIAVGAMGVRSAFGGTGADTLIGDDGDNWLAGGPGADKFEAGAGDDVLLIDAADDTTFVNGGAGLDIVRVIGK